ncbi:hypothetical protein [Methylobacterium sp. A54F]
MADDSAPPSPPSDARVAWSIAGLVVATVLVGALWPAPAAHGPAADPARDATCLEWADGCRVCQRQAEGPACSLPGIACQPTEPHCLRRAGE